MKRLRLLHTESSCGWGGQELRVLAESEGMLGRGHAVTLAAPEHAPIIAEARRRGLAVVPVPIGRKRPGALGAMRKLLRTHRPDLVITHSSTDSWLAALACLGWRGAPVQLRIRHVSAPIGNNLFTRWLYRRASAHVVTTGEALRRQVMREAAIGADCVSSVPTGIDLAQYRPGDRAAARQALGLSPGSFMVGIVATLRSWKGHLFLLDALHRCPDAELVIVGDGPMRDVLQQRAQALGLLPRIRFAGHQRDVLPWLHSLDVMALPSYANEGVPQALMQAMACGLPVISTPVGSIAEIVRDGDTGLLVAPRDAAALAQAIRRLQSDAALRERLGAAAAQEARVKFSVEQMLEAMERIYARVMEQSAPLQAPAVTPDGRT